MASLTFTSPNRPLTWLITGCSNGLGLLLARLALSHGHRVIATSRNPSRTPDLVAEFDGHPSGSRWLQLDVDDVLAGGVIASLAKESPPVEIDVLVNNAGWSIHQITESLTDDDYKRQMETLFFGPMRLVAAAVPGMRERRFGVIVGISSGAGLDARESMAAYGAAKAALEGAYKVLAKEVAPFNVRAIITGLGTTNTNFGNTVQIGTRPYAEDYKGSAAETLLKAMASRQFVGDGDPQKMVQGIYEVIMGEGVGKGREAERYLPLGRDMAKRVVEVRDKLNHALEVFGDVANNVYVEK